MPVKQMDARYLEHFGGGEKRAPRAA